MSGKRRSQSQIIRDRRRIADLYLTGKTQQEIADELGISQATVSRDIKALHEEWIASSLADFDRAKAMALAENERLKREYWEAWQESRQDKEAKTAEKRGGQDSRAVKRTEAQNGDPRFLSGIQRCLDRYCEIHGVYAAGKLDLTSGGKPITFIQAIPPSGEVLGVGDGGDG